jgi:hypothetical protein
MIKNDLLLKGADHPRVIKKFNLGSLEDCSFLYSGIKCKSSYDDAEVLDFVTFVGLTI